MFPHFSSFESIFGVHWGILRADLSLLRADLSLLRADLSLLRADLSLTARGTVSLPPVGRQVYRPRDGMFTARRAVSNAP